MRSSVLRHGAAASADENMGSTRDPHEEVQPRKYASYCVHGAHQLRRAIINPSLPTESDRHRKKAASAARNPRSLPLALSLKMVLLRETTRRYCSNRLHYPSGPDATAGHGFYHSHRSIHSVM